MNPTIFLIDTCPNFCPMCGKDLARQFTDPLNLNDWECNASHSCECGAHYQKVSEKALIETAGKEGDLDVYLKA